MLRSKSKIKGKMSWRVFEHSPEGLRKLASLQELFLAGKLTKEEHDERVQVILDNRKLSWTKRRKLTRFQKIMRRSSLMAGVNHNIVTNEGDAMIADIMAETPARVKIDNTNGYIEIGTGFVSEAKTVELCVTQVAIQDMDATYPKLKGTWGNTDDNVTQYRVTFAAGEGTGIDIDEGCLGNNAVAATGDALAYAEITPKVTVGASDTLQVDWELTYLGA